MQGSKMARVECPECNHKFEGSPIKKGLGAIGGAAAGAKLGSGLGIAAGPMGAIAGTVPGAIIGGVTGLLASSKVYICSECGKTFTA